MIVKTRILPPGAAAFAFWPFLFVHPDEVGRQGLLPHENEHLASQRLWALRGLIIPGLLAWYFLYLCCLPVGWNWFRAREEHRAMRAEGRSEMEISEALRKAPYYLWWH